MDIKKGGAYVKSVEKLNNKPIILKKRKRVAAYARVSMESERMAHSLSAQVSYYANLIQKNPEWEYAGVYADNFISGTSIERRAEFKRMIQDCETGKIDIILTKSISRFARNTIDLLQTVRRLKELGIEVRFEKERINSLSNDGELMLTILASFAQEESRSISENVKWATVKRFKQGIPNGKFGIYGYRWDGDRLVIEPKEAEIVRFIYDKYLHGTPVENLERQLEEMGVKSFKGGHFGNSSIRVILKNVTYTGNFLFQKEYVENPLTKRRKPNHGELPKFWVENTHEAIISMDTFQQVQEERVRRRELGVRANPHIHTSCFTSKLRCALCGTCYRRRTKKQMTGTIHSWMCRGKDEKGVKFCNAKTLPEVALIDSCCKVLGLSEFSEDVFSERVDHITVCENNLLIFHMTDGTEVHHTWEFKSTARTDWWTPERRRLWGEYQKKKWTPERRKQFSELEKRRWKEKC